MNVHRNHPYQQIKTMKQLSTLIGFTFLIALCTTSCYTATNTNEPVKDSTVTATELLNTLTCAPLWKNNMATRMP